MIHKAITLGEGEEIVTVVRRHWFHVAVAAAIDISLLVGAVIGVSVVAAALSSATGGHHAAALSVYAIALVSLLLWMHFFAVWSDHWLDAWIITNKRIIDIEQHGFFRRQVSSFPLNRIQDVTFSINGVIAMWLHFGDIRIQTASISDDLIMRQVPFPEDVKEQVMQVLDMHR